MTHCVVGQEKSDNSNLRTALCRVVCQLKGVEGLRARLKVMRFIRNWNTIVDLDQVVGEEQHSLTLGEALEDQLILMLAAERVISENVLSGSRIGAIDWLALIDFLKKILPIILDIIALLLVLMRKPDNVNTNEMNS